MGTTQVKAAKELIQDGSVWPSGWGAKAVIHEDNLSYVLWNESSKETLIIDPMREDWEALLRIAGTDLRGHRFVAIIDTHTHADHVSCAAQLAESLGVPLIQHQLSPSKRVHLRVCRDLTLTTAAGPLLFLETPGHTPDSLTPMWGPFICGGDTLLFGDTGRDDLPGGDPGAHWESLQKFKRHARPEMLLLPGHDQKGGRISSWAHQLEISQALKQDKATFMKDGGAWVGAAPKLLKESLFENFK